MAKVRKIKKVFKSKPTIEGAGVHLKRAFGNQHVPMLDPFLLLDDFHSDNPAHYLKGFPWHPHRGIETITYVLHGKVEHGDSMGNKGIIQPGDVQWMTAGSGIIHQEMPKGEKDGLMWGFQLWANLPAANKMMDPRYQEIKSRQIPEVSLDGGVQIKIICGEVYFDRERDTYAYEVEGENYFDFKRECLFGAENLILFEDGDEMAVTTQDEPVRFLLISGKPIREPVAWYGPIVMNTQAELRVAFEEYERGTFVKHKMK
ncbi:MAG: Pirin domain protein [Deltaproteobacteria bacterium]|nr:Pirin domain protein [Deltaproteobacteria bacterium]